MLKAIKKVYNTISPPVLNGFNKTLKVFTPLQNFISAASSPALFAFVGEFWYHLMDREKTDDKVLITNSPLSVKVFLGVMVSYGVLNVLLEDIYLRKKIHHVKQANEDKEKLIQILNTIIERNSTLVKENDHLSKFVEFFKSKHNLNSQQRDELLQIYDLNLAMIYKQPEFKEVLAALERIKSSTKATVKYLSNRCLRTSTIIILSIFSFTAGFGMPIGLALTINALIQDLTVLPFGQGLLYGFTVLGFLSSSYQGLKTYRTLRDQRKEENNLIRLISENCGNCITKMKEFRQNVKDNRLYRIKIKDALKIENESLSEVPSYKFDLLEPLMKLDDKYSRRKINDNQDEETGLLYENEEYGTGLSDFSELTYQPIN